MIVTDSEKLKNKNDTKNPIPVWILLRFVLFRVGLIAFSFAAFQLYNQPPYLYIRVTSGYQLFLIALFLMLPLQSFIGLRILARRYHIPRWVIGLFFIFLLLLLVCCLLLALFALLMNLTFSSLAFGPGTCEPAPDGSVPAYEEQVAIYEPIRYMPFEVLRRVITQPICGG